MKKNLFIITLFSGLLSAQVGINTHTPTEKLDINGTLRVRNLPNDGEIGIYTTGENTSSGSKDQNFIASKPLVVDSYGIIGTTTFGNLVPNTNTWGTSSTKTQDSSEAMFIVKRFIVEDTQGGLTGSFYTQGFDTSMKVDSWQAIMSNISFKMTSAPTDEQFILGSTFNYHLKGVPGENWKIVGDIVNVKEKAFVDILFIKSEFVAAEPRVD